MQPISIHHSLTDVVVIITPISQISCLKSKDFLRAFLSEKICEQCFN